MGVGVCACVCLHDCERASTQALAFEGKFLSVRERVETGIAEHLCTVCARPRHTGKDQLK